MVAHGTLLDPMNDQLLIATGVQEEGYNTRFAVVDVEVDKLYGKQIRNYFREKGIELRVCLVNGGEADKRNHVRILLYDVFLDDIYDFELEMQCSVCSMGLL
jgi:3-dehydroquinate synthetase